MGSCASAQQQQAGNSPKSNTRKAEDTYSSSSTEPRNSVLAGKVRQVEREEDINKNGEQEERNLEEEEEEQQEEGEDEPKSDQEEQSEASTEEDEEQEEGNDAATDEDDDDNNDSNDNNDNDDDDDNNDNDDDDDNNDNNDDVDDGDGDGDDDDDDAPKIMDNDVVVNIIQGQIDIEVPSQVRLVRIFTSSTFTDTFVERNNLMEKVYPKLKKYCQSLGYDFQVVDMRWGVRDEATDDHMTSELCMRELSACQKLSTGPNFITFLGQKYGYRPFPPKIHHSEFEAMLATIKKRQDKDLLTKWFIKDNNLVPAMYTLQPVRSLLPNYNNRSVSDEERRAASGQWWEAFEAMQGILREAAIKAKLSENQAAKYRISVTDDEIRRGIINAKQPNKHCYWFKRNIVDLKENLDKSKARMFIDKTSNGLDDEAVSLLESLKSDGMLKVLSKDSVIDYDVEWCGEACIDPVASDKHRQYIEKLCVDFYDTLVAMINRGIEEKKKADLEDNLVKEISLHTTTCQEKSSVFYGREKVLKAILQHVESEDSTKPVLVVHGESGCGKTSIMAVAAKRVKKQHPNVPLILRFLGTTSESSSIGKLLYSICVQLCRITNTNIADIPESFKKMVDYFAEQLENIDTKVFIFLDSLDQLSADNGGLNMKWLPKENISENVRIVVSTLPGDEYKVFPALKTRVTDKDAFINVPVLPQKTAHEILDAWLKNANHTITKQQKSLVMAAFDKCRLPLFLKLSFDEAIRWKSYLPLGEARLQPSIKEAINELFARIERLHGHALVSHALGYITASVNGLTDAEIDDVLSIDDQVLNDVYQYWTPPIRRIPPLLWIRIKTDLGPYMVSRGADGVLVNTWYHRQFIETARERYLEQDDGSVAKRLHETLSEYFLGTWSDGVRKPFTSKQGDDGEKDRLVPSQPNMFAKRIKKDGDKDDGSLDKDVVYNYRKLSELPRHLIRAGKLETLKNDLIFNYEFLSAQLCARGLQSALQMFSEALDVCNGETEIELIRDCLKMSSKALFFDPNQLAAQLNGRLSHVSGFEQIASLLQQSRATIKPCLYPCVSCFEKPGGPLVYSLAGHSLGISCACVTKDGKRMLSTSQDNTLKLWDLTTGEELRTYDVERDYSIIKLFNNESCVILSGYSGLTALDLDTEEILFNEDNIVGQYGTCMDLIANETKIVHAGNEIISIFDVNEREIKPAQTYNEVAIENNTGYYDIIRGGGNYYAYSRGRSTELTIRKADNPDYMKKLKVPYGLMYFVFNDTGTELLVLGTNSEMNAQYKEVHLVIWDTSSWNILKDSKSKFDAMIVQVYDMSIAKLKTGYELIWPVIFQINFWNLNTNVERVALKSGYQGNQYKTAITADGRYLVVVSIDYTQRAIQVYNLDLLDYIVGGDQHLSAIEKSIAYVGQGEREAFLCATNPEIILSIPPAEAVVTVWNARYHDRERKVRFVGLFPIAMYCMNERYFAMWDSTTRKIFLIDYIDGKIEGEISGKGCETPPSSMYSNTWHYVGEFNFIAVAENGKDINLWNIKSGKLLNTIKTGSSFKITNLLASKDNSTMLVSVTDAAYTEATMPVFIIDLKAMKKIAEINIKDQRLDLRPEVTALSDDGKILYLLFSPSEYITGFDTRTGKEVIQITFTSDRIKDEYDPGDNVTFYCIAVHSDYIVACFSCYNKIGTRFDNQFCLACFDRNTGATIASCEGAFYQKIFISQKGNRVMGMSHPTGEGAKALELWDLSGLKENRIQLLGRFLPETDLRFSHMTTDERCVVTGMAGTEELVFMRMCGDEPKLERPENWTEKTIVYTAAQDGK